MENRADYLPHPEGPAEILFRILFGRNRRRYAFLACSLFVIIAVILNSGSAFEYRTDALAPVYAYAPQSGEAVSQVLPQEKRVLKALGIRFYTYERVNAGEIVVRFFKNGKEVKNWVISSADLIDNAYREFRFDREIKTEADDTCHFTVSQTYEGPNQVALWMTGPTPEAEEVSEDEDEQNTPETDTLRIRTQDSILCYQLTLQDNSFRGAVMLPFVFALVLLLAAAAFLVSFSRITMLRILAVTLFVLVLTGTVATDLFQEIVRDVPVRSYEGGSTKIKLAPEETMEEAFEANLCGFSSVEFSIAVTAGRSESVHVRLDNEDLDETLYEETIRPADMLAGGPGGRRIRIHASQTSVGKLFPKGKYRLYVTNTDQEKKLRICVRKVVLAAAETENSQDSESESDGTKDSSGDDGENREDEDRNETRNEEGAEEQEQTELHINIALLRTSALGYRIACIILFLLGVYVLAVVLLTSRKKATLERFFLASAVPLGIIYLILMLPWSPPDSGSHILAANRFSNILLGAEKEEQWMVRAVDAEYFPQAWKEGTVEEQHFPCMEEYAGTFLREKSSNDMIKEEDSEDSADMKKDYGDEEIAGSFDPVAYFADVKMEYYSMINYLPQTLGLTLGKLLKFGSVPAVYLGRILILAAYIAACAHAVRITPVGKAVFAGIALLPMSLMLSSAYSYDVTVLISTLCFTASILRAYHESSSSVVLIECAVWAAVIGGTKGGGYLVLLPLVFLFFFGNGSGNDPANVIGKEQLRRNALRAVPVVAAGLLSILVFDVLLPTGALFQFGESGNGRLTFSYALAHPLKYLQMLLSAFIQYADSLTINIGGTALSWIENTIPAVFIMGLLLLIAVHAVFENDLLQFKARDKRTFLTVILLEVLLMPAMLLSWTPVGSRRIEGIQGRYFLPVLPLIYFVLTKFRLHWRADHSKNTDSVVGRSCMHWFCLISCICVYYMLRLYLTR